MEKLKFIAIVLFVLMAVGIVFAAESIKYDFDDVDVKYAAEFTAKPIKIDSNDNWIVRIAGGADKPIKVLYGVVILKKEGETQMSEEFIKVSGEGGSERFLLNSAAFDYYEGTSNYRSIRSFFWSAKKLVDATVVKDFTLPIKSITFYRKFNEAKEMYAVMLSFSNDGGAASQEFWSGAISGSVYEADMNNLNQSGDPVATSSQPPTPTVSPMPEQQPPIQSIPTTTPVEQTVTPNITP